jgi:hypothetical protein
MSGVYDFLTVTSLVSQKLSHPWLRGSQRPSQHRCMSLLSSPPSLSSNSVFCAWRLTVDIVAHVGWGITRDLSLHVGSWAFYPQLYTNFLCCAVMSKPSNPKNLLSQELQSLFWFLSTFPSLAGLNHLLDAEGNEVAQQDTWLSYRRKHRSGTSQNELFNHPLGCSGGFLGTSQGIKVFFILISSISLHLL